MKKIYSLTEAKLTSKKSSIWTGIFVDPLSIRLSLLIGNSWNLNPNIVTITSIVLGIVSSFFFYKHDYVSLLFGVFFFQLSFFLDSVDGKLARLTNRVTELGARLDFLRDKLIHTLNLIFLTYGSYIQSQDTSLPYLAILYYIILFANWAFFTPTAQKNNPRLTSVEAMMFVFLVGPIIQNIRAGLVFAILLLSLIISQKIIKKK